MLEHLAELRQRIIICVLAAAMGILAAFFYALPIIEILKAMASPVVLNAHGMVEFVQLTPGEVLMASLKLSVCLGLAAASPIMLYQILRFVMPGLNQREKWQLLWVVLAGALLFVSGVAFSYFLVVPSALGYLLEYGQQVAKSQISIAQYVDFCLSLLLLSGVVFELPLLLFFLSLIGLLSSGLLLSQWRQAMVGVALAAAVLTPSQDPLTMIIVGCAMAGLYFLSVVPIRLSGR
ncbi:MAG: twin-arginine translocase subunit TatC [Vampirovibrionales bacterium]|nr:twin-arginine translocase subunit TatC [Vampirovibrionales bacterium]